MQSMFKSSFALVLLLSYNLSSQVIAQGREIPAQELEEYREQARSLVEMFEFTLNLLGSSETSAREKDVIINQSYLKMFRDDKVQIEDDLVENRGVITNKNIQAYLKDVDFFFRDVAFEFTIRDVDHYVKDNGELFFKVTVDRNLQGTTVEKEELNVNKVRYIEVNLDREARNLLVASVYTTRLSEAEELTTWWDNMSIPWQVALKRAGAIVADTANLQQIRIMAKLQELDASGINGLTDLAPLAQMNELRSLVLTGVTAEDLAPVRNLTKLEVLRLSNSRVTSLAPLRYASNLRELYIDGSLITDISPVANYLRLERLHCQSTAVQSIEPVRGLAALKDLRFHDTPVQDLEPVRSLQQLEMLQVSFTQVSDLSPLAGLAKLERLLVDNTQITDLAALSQSKSLKLLNCDNTQISSLAPLGSLSQLERIYCDNTQVSREEASRFMAQRSGVLVIFNSSRLGNWWQELPVAWQQLFRKLSPMDEQPTKEQLQTLANLKELNTAGRTDITSLEPLQELVSLKRLDASGTGISDLSALRNTLDLEVLNVHATQLAGKALEPIRGLANLRELNIGHTRITELPGGSFPLLEYVILNNTPVSTIVSLNGLSNLKKVVCEGASVSRDELVSFAFENPEALVVFRTAELESWWAELPGPWRQVFQRLLSLPQAPNADQLHQITSLSELNLADNAEISQLNPLMVFTNLRDLRISNTRVSSLNPVAQLLSLERLECSRSPIGDLSPLRNLVRLRVLNVENTAVQDLGPLENLIQLENLKISGTQVRNLKPLQGLTNLKVLECYNTNVRVLSPLEDLPNLVTLVVYNSNVSSGRIARFKRAQPDCEVIYY